MPEVAPDPSNRVARVRVAQGVSAATVLATCGAFVAFGFAMSAGADSTRPGARAHAAPAGADGSARTAAPATTSVPKPAAASRPPANTTAVSALAASGIPKVALNAYRVAAARVTHAEASCGIRWYLLAGIGRVESNHGQFAGAVLHTDGLSTPKIIGPPLDGKGNQFIPAPANGLALDGDAKYAHALGPMQFIPSTWEGWGADANGDGSADIFNINDAALGAARYLCAAGGDLRTGAGQSRAILAYNHLTSYRDEVLALADAYRRGITPTGPLLGNTTGSLPRTGHTGSLPPATAGAPVTAATTARRPAPPTAPTASRPHPRPGSSGRVTHSRRPTPKPSSTRSTGHPRTPVPSCPSSSTTSGSSTAASSTPPSTPSSSASSSPSCHR